MPRATPRVLANVQLVPPRSAAHPERKSRELNRDMTEELNRDGSIGLPDQRITGAGKGWTQGREKDMKDLDKRAENIVAIRRREKRCILEMKTQTSESRILLRAAPTRKPSRTAAVMIVGKSRFFIR